MVQKYKNKDNFPKFKATIFSCFFQKNPSRATMSDDPKNTPRFDDLLGLNLYLNIQLWFITVKGGKGKSENEKDMWGKVLGKPVVRFQSPLSVEPHGTHVTPPAQIVTPCVEGCQAGKFIRDSEPRVCIGGLSHRLPLRGTYPEF